MLLTQLQQALETITYLQAHTPEILARQDETILTRELDILKQLVSEAQSFYERDRTNQN